MISNSSFTSTILILGTYSIIILYRHKIFCGQKNTKMLLFRFIISPLLTQFFPIKTVWNDFCFSVPGQILLLNQTQISFFQESFPYLSNPLFELDVPPTVIITLDFKLFMFFFLQSPHQIIINSLSAVTMTYYSQCLVQYLPHSRDSTNVC